MQSLFLAQGKLNHVLLAILEEMVHDNQEGEESNCFAVVIFSGRQAGGGGGVRFALSGHFAGQPGLFFEKPAGSNHAFFPAGQNQKIFLSIIDV